jgi:DNA-binding winged helix-turn-helix (wHTH) protein
MNAERWQMTREAPERAGMPEPGAPQKASPPQLAYEFPPFRLPHDVDVLYRAGEVVPLERQAVRVLRYIVANRHRVVPKEELLERLWPDTFTSDGVLKRLVMLARRALGETHKEARYIQTLHRRGYRFVGAVTQERAAGATTGGGERARGLTDSGARRVDTRPRAGARRRRRARRTRSRQ